MKQFTMDEIKILKQNPYTKNVTGNYIRFTVEFKEKFLFIDSNADCVIQYLTE